MRFTALALQERGVSDDRIWLSLERSMTCATGHCGHCQLGPAVHLQGRPGAAPRRRRTAHAGGGAVSPRRSLAVWKFASCDGCQLSLLDCEDELLALAGELDIAYFIEAGLERAEGELRPVDRRGVDHDRRGGRAHPRDPRPLAPADLDRRVRDRRRHPGAAQLRRRRRLRVDRLRQPAVHLDAARTRRPPSEHVAVDFELNGCPPDKGQLLEVISAYLNERRPQIAAHSVCIECKRRGNVCVMVAHGTPCLGPVTHAGCGALCPSYHRGCYGCFGPMEQPNAGSLGGWLAAPRPARARRRAPVPHLLRGRAGVPRRERGARWLSARSSPRCSPAWRARARWRCASATARSRTCKLRIYEPPRFFEAFLRGPALHRGAGHHRAHLRHLPGRLPDELDRGDGGRLRRRGRRPGARAAADALLRRVGREPRAARLHAARAGLPRATPTAFEMARDHREVVEGALQLKKAGNELMRVIGGREIHPINVRVGGFYRAPTRAELAPVVEQLERAREFAIEAVSFTASLPCPDFEEDFVFVALRDPDVYAIEGGRLVSSTGLDLAPSQYDEHVVEEHVEHSTALHSQPARRHALPRRSAGPLRAQPRPALAGRARGRRRRRPRAGVPQPVSQHRRARGRDRLRARRGAAAARRLRAAGPAGGRGRPARGRGVRLDRGAARPALAPLRDRRRRARSSTRGSCRPTSQNQGRIEQSLHGFVQQHVELADDELQLRCEQAVRSYDPCISCATHFLRLEIDRG